MALVPRLVSGPLTIVSRTDMLLVLAFCYARGQIVCSRVSGRVEAAIMIPLLVL